MICDVRVVRVKEKGKTEKEILDIEVEKRSVFNHHYGRLLRDGLEYVCLCQVLLFHLSLKNFKL